MELKLGKTLGVWAHPDDETYLAAGIMAKAVREGSHVVCVTATKGEAGSQDHVKWPPEEMGEVRAAELLSSLAILGVSQHRWLGYRDGNCADVNPQEGTARIKEIIEEVLPETVLTFGPDGITDHPDHKAVCEWTTGAFEQVAPAGARLFYAALTPEWCDRFLPVMNKFNVFPSGPPPAVAIEDLELFYELEPELLELKLRAFEAHESQVEAMMAAFGADFFRKAHGAEAFRLASRKN